MKRLFLLLTVVVLSVYFTGCGKQDKSLEEMQEPMSIEEIGQVNTESITVPGEGTGSLVIEETAVVAPILEPVPPPPYNPTNTQIQTALKNAGYDPGAIDGKIGPATKKAIEAFQGANGLKVDGKVGPKTWGVLEKYLAPPQPKAKY